MRINVTSDEAMRVIDSGGADKETLLKLMGHPVLSVRTSAVAKYVKQFAADTDAVVLIISELQSQNMQRFLTGTIRLAYWTVGCLLDSNEPHAIRAAREAVSKWPRLDISDLEWFLKHR